MHQNTCKPTFVLWIVWCQSIMWIEKQDCILTNVGSCHPIPLHLCTTTHYFNVVPLSFPEWWGTVEQRTLPPQHCPLYIERWLLLISITLWTSFVDTIKPLVFKWQIWSAIQHFLLDKIHVKLFSGYLWILLHRQASDPYFQTWSTNLWGTYNRALTCILRNIKF